MYCLLSFFLVSFSSRSVSGFHLLKDALIDAAEANNDDFADSMKYGPGTGNSLNYVVRTQYVFTSTYSDITRDSVLVDFMQSADIRYDCTTHCRTSYKAVPNWDKFACFAGCACDSNLDLNGNSISSCSDYCIGSRFAGDTAYSTYAGLFDSKFFKYMEWFTNVGSGPRGGLIRAKLYETGRSYHSAFYLSSYFQPDPCLDGCAQRGICDEFTEPPPTSEPTQAPPTSEPTDSTLVESTNEPTDAPSSPTNEPTDAPSSSTNEPTDSPSSSTDIEESVFDFDFAVSLDSINTITVLVCSIPIIMTVDLVSQ